MIRDPSDGSVREKPVLDTATTGLAPAVTPQQAEERARLDRSRQWLSKYRTNPERVARMTGEGNLQENLAGWDQGSLTGSESSERSPGRE